MHSIVRRLLFLAACLPVAAGAQPGAALKVPAPAPIRGAHYPALSPDGTAICFEYLGDLWVAPAQGGTARRLTVHPAYDAYPHWSPDGRWIAFSANRNGNFDVFLIPARGGEAEQLTSHSADDFAMDWSPDGTKVLFASAREGRFTDLYTIGVKDHRLRRLTDDRTSYRYAVFSPDGKEIAATRGAQAWWRPRYRGSGHCDVYTLPAAGGKTRRITNFDGWNGWPMYAADGKELYYVSAQGGQSNLWRTGVQGGTPVQVTHHADAPVLFPSMARDGSAIVYEQGFKLWLQPLLDYPHTRTPARAVTVYAPSDEATSATRYDTLTSGASSLALSPDGKTLAFTARGELWTCPATGGDAVRLTTGSGAGYSPAWSPDGKTLAYATDRAGSLDVYVMDVKTHAERPVATDAADETDPRFSPDGHFLAWTRTGGTAPGLYVLPLASGGDFKASEAVCVAPGPGVGGYDWSPDARWLVYGKRDATATTDLWIVPSVGGTPVNVTRYPGANTSPQWSRDGRTIVFLSSRGSTSGMPAMGIYALPLMPREQERGRERPGEGEPPDSAVNAPPDRPAGQTPDDPDAQRRRRMPPPGPGAPPSEGGGPPAPPVPPRAALVQIEFDGIQDRARPVAGIREPIRSVTLAPDARTVVFAMAFGGQTDWWAVDARSGAMQRLTMGGESGSDVEFTPDATRFYFLATGGTIRQVTRGTPVSTPVTFSASMEVDRRKLVDEAFNEAWRNLRTRFYDPKMHGADWQALRARYEPLVKQTAAKEDFAWLLSSLIGELNASHLGVTPPTQPGPWPVTAYLGLTFDQDYAGPGLKVASVLPKGPADQVGHHVDPGEYVLAIDGTDAKLGEDLYPLLRDKAGKSVDLLVNGKPDKAGARTVTVRPITKSAADDLAYDAWVAERRRKVDSLSGGQLAYIHIRAMDQPSLQRFQRELFGDAQSKKGLVLDVRFNGGGRIHDDLLALLARKPHVYEVPRDGERATQPFQLWARPTVLLINEYSASDAEIFPNGFRAYGLGKLVGVPTMGAVIGTFDITLIDGTRFRIPTTGWYTLEGRNMENMGVQPDVRVEQTPEDNAADNDRQLEAAVKVLMDQMAAKP